MVRPKSKGLIYVGVGFIVCLGWFLLWGNTSSVQSQEESTCISCHTSVKELVNITREIAAKAPPAKSTESEGEG